MTFLVSLLSGYEIDIIYTNYSPKSVGNGVIGMFILCLTLFMLLFNSEEKLPICGLPPVYR